MPTIRDRLAYEPFERWHTGYTARPRDPWVEGTDDLSACIMRPIVGQGEAAFLMGMLAQALYDALLPQGGPHCLEARWWIFGQSDAPTISFDDVCTGLGLDPWAVRRCIEAQIARQTKAVASCLTRIRVTDAQCGRG